MAGAQPFRNDQVEAFADRLAFGEAEDAGRRLIPERDPALRVGIDDRLRAARDEPGREIVMQSSRQRIHPLSPRSGVRIDTARTRRALQTVPPRRAIAARDAAWASGAVRVSSRSR